MAPPLTLLCVLDGFGLNPNPKANAVAMAKKPVIDQLMKSCPTATLITRSERVGLPDGMMGNSEVGHLNIGAGRVVEQWLLRINRAFRGPFLNESKQYKAFLQNTDKDRPVHLIGLFSEGGVHSFSPHLFDLIERLHKDGRNHIKLHLLTDGRDTSPTASVDDIAKLEEFLSNRPYCSIATVCGRFFAMDRDKRWERTEKAYRAIAPGQAEKSASASAWVKASHAKGTTDEFIEPTIVSPAPIDARDGVVFWNFRADRMRQIVRAMCIESFDGFKRPQPIQDHKRVLCFTDYDSTFDLPYLFEHLPIENHLGQVVSRAGLGQIRAAETEKYPHVTYFFNGGSEESCSGEERILVPSPREVKTYDLKPEMSAQPLTDAVIKGIEEKNPHLVVLNFANPDMVGHTGVLEAAIKAVETVDGCLGRLLKVIEKRGGQALIIADHGNCEQMINYEDGTPHTSHTTYPVPVILWRYSKPAKLRDGGALCDVAPTILQMMGLPQPKEMTGKSLVQTA